MHRARRRWGDNDRHFGPLTFAFRESWRPLAVVLTSGSRDHGSLGCNVRFQAFGATMICELPQIIKPWSKWVPTGPRAPGWTLPGGDNGFWDLYPREFGFCLNDGHLSVKHGAQTNDSETDQTWGCFLPWTQWRQIEHRIFNADRSVAGEVATKSWDEQSRVTEQVTKARFAIIDFDEERIEVETYSEERVWRRGAGWFRWLGFIWPKKRHRSLNMRFTKEVGPEKGSWKGGMIGTSIEMLADETHEQAFRRFCDDEHRSKYRRFRVKFATAAA